MSPEDESKPETKRQCGVRSYDYGSNGYPCELPLGHKGQHMCLDKDDCPHYYGLVPEA